MLRNKVLLRDVIEGRMKGKHTVKEKGYIC